MENGAFETAEIGYDDDARSQFVLRKDIVIPAGTQFTIAPTKVERFGSNHVEVIVALSKDTCGTLSYFVDPNDPAIAEWFESID